MTDAREAVQEFHAAVAQPEMALVIFFCSVEYDLEAVAEEMDRLFDGVQIVGCTTAGEIGPAGYRDNSISGASFPAEDFTAASGLIGSLRQFGIAGDQAFPQELLQRLESRAPQANADNTFAFLLIDGLSESEELVTHALQSALGDVPMVGGSAGDNLRFAKAAVFFEGQFHSNSEVPEDRMRGAIRLPRSESRLVRETDF